MAKIKWASVPATLRWNRLKYLREERGYTRQVVAVGAGVSTMTLYLLENGFEKKSTTETREKIARFFKCDVEDIFPADRIGDVSHDEFIRISIEKRRKE